MKPGYPKYLSLLMAAAAVSSAALADRSEPVFEWLTVVNNNDAMPPLAARNFNSYNQPSVNTNGLVVIRARSRGGPPLGPPIHGIYQRDMSIAGSEIVRVLDKTTAVPQPNNLGSLFVETPSFPRIDMHSGTIATRGNHGPVHRYVLDDGSETRAGTTGIYSNPYGELITGAAKLGNAPGFGFFAVPEFNEVAFEVFPGAPAVANGNTIVFKGNYTVDGSARTGVYYRHLLPEAAGGTSPAVMIANNTDSLIPGTFTVFGSTAPPNAADRKAVFAGFDDEESPTLGGIYLAPLRFQPPLTALVSIGDRVPGGSSKDRFNAFGEGIAFDGRYVGFWGSWGKKVRTLRLYCPQEGNKDRIDYCNQALSCADSGQTIGDPGSVCDDEDDPNFGVRCYTEKTVPLKQGFFVHDTRTKYTQLVAQAGERFADFLFWNYSGKTPCAGSGHSEEGGEDDGESVRWRSSAFVAVSAGVGATYNVAFKARTADFDGIAYVDTIDGIYFSSGPGRTPITTVVDTTMPGQSLDPEAPPDSIVSEAGIEREGLRGRWLAINASMGIEGAEEEEGMAGIYIARLK